MHFRLDSLQSLGWIAHVCTLGKIALNIMGWIAYVCTLGRIALSIIGLESPCMHFRLDSQTNFISHAAT